MNENGFGATPRLTFNAVPPSRLNTYVTGCPPSCTCIHNPACQFPNSRVIGSNSVCSTKSVAPGNARVTIGNAGLTVVSGNATVSLTSITSRPLKSSSE